ncbi:MAG: Gfo/Idh/MocA family oxidoreductase [Erysipelotrichaceae bacterium]
MKFAVIGTNFVSDMFMEGLSHTDDASVIGVCSGRMENAIRFSEKYKIPKVYRHYKEVIEDKSVEAVYVATPNAMHKEIVIFFLSNKVPVFCEKPMGSNFDEVKEMVDCARENHTYLHEGIVPLFNPNFKILKKSLDKVGVIRQVTYNFSKYSSRYDQYLAGENPTTFRRELANGAIMDLGVYVFTHVIALFGKPISMSSKGVLLETGVDVAGSSLLEYKDFIANLSYSKASDTGIYCEICGEKGTIEIDHPTQIRSIKYTDRQTKEVQELAIDRKPIFHYQIQEMIDCINHQEIESKSNPLELSLLISECMYECRKQANVIFPQDEGLQKK